MVAAEASLVSHISQRLTRSSFASVQQAVRDLIGLHTAVTAMAFVLWVFHISQTEVAVQASSSFCVLL